MSKFNHNKDSGRGKQTGRFNDETRPLSSRHRENITGRGVSGTSSQSQTPSSSNAPRSGGRDFAGRGQGGRQNQFNQNQSLGRYSSSSNRIPHMGDFVQHFLKQPGMYNDVLAVINPPLVDRDRSNNIKPLLPSGHEQSIRLPGVSNWRYESRIGRPIKIVSNHFKIQESSLPSTIYQYSLKVYMINQDGQTSGEDISPKMNIQQSTALLMGLLDKHSEWAVGREVGLAYNGKSIVYTSSFLPLPSMNGNSHLSDIVCLVSDTRKFKLEVNLSSSLHINDLTYRSLDNSILSALDSSLFAFARFQVVRDNPDWFLLGSKAFSKSSQIIQLTPSYVAMKGHYAALKSCLAGLVLVYDMTMACFLSGGPMIDMFIAAGGIDNFKNLLNECRRPSGLNKYIADRIHSVIRNCKLRLNYDAKFGKSKNCFGIGPASNSKMSEFNYGGINITVEKYFMLEYKINLQYPELPCINIGSNSKRRLIPIELLLVLPGQYRSQTLPTDVTRKLIQRSSIGPNERFKSLCNNSDSLISIIKSDLTNSKFGIATVDQTPMTMDATLLPPAKLQYAYNQIVDPGLNGKWSDEGKKFFISGSQPESNLFGFLIINPEQGWQWLEPVRDYVEYLENVSKSKGCELKIFNAPEVANSHNMKEKLSYFRDANVRIIFVLLSKNTNDYGIVKKEAGLIGITTQCIKWDNILKKEFIKNILVKVNTKIGGTNCVLSNRNPLVKSNTISPTYQTVPFSISWLFDKPFMLVGMDVSHPEIGIKNDSIYAIVASMDGMLSQYATYISSQKSRQEIITSVEDAMVELLSAYRNKNGFMPETIIVFRDGVSEGQFSQIIDVEVDAMKSALRNYKDNIKIAVLICQKRYHTRLVYEDNGNYFNPCPGVLVDYNSGPNSITSATINEFYLVSHAPIQGTSKSCKYTVIYDEIGFKMCEIELLTYWTTYLYARTNRSVSYATPAYYAHWASKLGRAILSAGATRSDFQKICENFMNVPFFL